MTTPAPAEVWLADANTPEPELYRTETVEIASLSVRHPEHDHNEDCAMVVPLANDTLVLAVADGGGGARGGEQASRAALTALTGSLVEPEPVRGSILKGLEAANEDVLGLGMGAFTTLTAVSIEGPIVRTYQIGDSGALVVGQRGRIKHQTVSHSPVGYAVEAGLLDQTEALQHEERHVVSNVLGSRDMSIEMGPALELAARDRILLATDGLFDNCSVDEIVDVSRAGDVRKAISRLREICGQRMSSTEGSGPGKPDDLTVVLLRRLRARREVGG